MDTTSIQDATAMASASPDFGVSVAATTFSRTDCIQYLPLGHSSFQLKVCGGAYLTARDQLASLNPGKSIEEGGSYQVGNSSNAGPNKKEW